ncbi:NUDIX hydrolase [Cytobacillus sp. FJAT-54145]|uniref:NUDIX hydrolase n=1 Tax=Cytobacillus spartinae TaxID=3299023 RepID=A0ABW6KF51_9BACI
MDAVFKTEKGVFNYRVVGVWIIDNYVLLHREAKDDHWSLPGGRVALMEESGVALKREFQEELGIDVTVERLLWSVENFFQYDHMDFHEIGLYYKVCAENHSLFSNEEFHGNEGERLIYKWIPIDELSQITLYPEVIHQELQRGLSDYPKHLVVR